MVFMFFCLIPMRITEVNAIEYKFGNMKNVIDITLKDGKATAEYISLYPYVRNGATTDGFTYENNKLILESGYTFEITCADYDPDHKGTLVVDNHEVVYTTNFEGKLINEKNWLFINTCG